MYGVQETGAGGISDESGGRRRILDVQEDGIRVISAHVFFFLCVLICVTCEIDS